ncbi:hypothetical protein K227x_25120 [Rubripirellula lacrimiformis]|uniref:Uncharacterized protein n=1 Tax=Rubripirellula lacrimiformis TaxID=1930273 RepID=A0A517NAG6_9BACT|nr:hypothetical protein K227x_25120 [Rubripirellula lacrimiformis]
MSCAGKKFESSVVAEVVKTFVRHVESETLVEFRYAKTEVLVQTHDERLSESTQMICAGKKFESNVVAEVVKTFVSHVASETLDEFRYAKTEVLVQTHDERLSESTQMSCAGKKFESNVVAEVVKTFVNHAESETLDEFRYPKTVVHVQSHGQRLSESTLMIGAGKKFEFEFKFEFKFVSCQSIRQKT